MDLPLVTEPRRSLGFAGERSLDMLGRVSNRSESALMVLEILLRR